MSKQLDSSLLLKRWFLGARRILPWRDQPTLYRVWISEIMLQQTQVKTVIPYFENFIKTFPDVKVLARSSIQEVNACWAGLGYYSRARNLHRAAQMIAENGFPKNREEWLRLPGVGEYTAGAICSIALDQPEAILDGNVERVLSRFYQIDRSDGDSIYKKTLWEHSAQWVVRAHQKKIAPSLTNQALMELGATVCTYKNPDCLHCPIHSQCKAYSSSRVSEYPPPKKKREWVIVKEKRVCWVRPRFGTNPERSTFDALLFFNPDSRWRKGLWDLPEEDSFLREPRESFGEVETRHIVTHHKIHRKTKIFRSKKFFQLPKEKADGIRFQWVPLENPQIPLGAAAKKTLSQIEKELSGLTNEAG